MSVLKTVKSALLSVYHKDGLEEILQLLVKNNVKLISTGGTADHIRSCGYECTEVETVTGYPSILGGRVKTLHPKIFGGILYQRHLPHDCEQTEEYSIPDIDLVIVDLYPFEDTLRGNASDEEIIEKIDIGGISLIRAAAKNYRDVLVVASKQQYQPLQQLLEQQGACSDLHTRRKFAAAAFAVSSAYDTAIFNYFDNGSQSVFRYAQDSKNPLRYGENPHQQAAFFGDFASLFSQLHGKEISYNNLLDIEAAVSLIAEFDETTLAIVKHNNACGAASRNTVSEAWKCALAGDPVSAFGGIIVCNRLMDEESASEIDNIFFEVIIAPEYSPAALELLKQKKNRIILLQNAPYSSTVQFRSILGGVLRQQCDSRTETEPDLQLVTGRQLQTSEIADLLFANKIVKHSKSNAITLAKDRQLCASGIGQTSRVDALKQAIDKAQRCGFDLQGAVMASDAFFPFPDCVEIAHKAGITAIVQPGGSLKDSLSVEYCNKNHISMCMTGNRHFKH